MDLPSPTHYLIPLATKFLFHRMLFQINEELFVASALHIEVFGKYFALKNRATKESGFYMNLQTCFPRKAWLKRVRSLKPKPPCDLGLHNSFHFFKWTLLWSGVEPHQNRAQAASISLTMLSGMIKHDIVKVGIDCITYFNKTYLPPCEKVFSFHPWSFFNNPVS